VSLAIPRDPQIAPAADGRPDVQVQLEAARRDNAALLRILDLHSQVSVTDTTGRILEVNDNFCKISGFTRDELLGKPHSIINSGTHSGAFWADLWGTIAAGRPWQGDICNRAKDGSANWSSCVIGAFFDEDGSVARYISVRTDISSKELIKQKGQASEAFLERTGRAAGIGGWEYDLQTGAILWSGQMNALNDRAADYQPTTTDEGFGLYDDESRPLIEHAVEQARRTGKGWDLELRKTTPKGRKIWVRHVGEVEFDAGRPVRLVGSMQDITARKLTEASLRETTERLAIASGSASIGAWELNLESDRLTWDEWMYSIYGLDRTGPTEPYAAWIASIHPDDRALCEQAIAAARRGEREFDAEFRIVRPDGEIRHLRSTGRTFRGADGVPNRLTGVNIDVSERQRTAQELLGTSSLLRTVLNSTSDISIIATAPNLTIKVFNAGAEQMLGYTGEELVGRTTPWTLYDPADVRACAGQLGVSGDTWELFVQPSMLNIPLEWNCLHKDGRRIAVSQVVVPMHAGDGELLGYVSVARDITLQKKHEKSMRLAMHRAEQASRAKSEFLANMSHEIRTPMNAVIGLSYLLGQTPLNAQQSLFLDNINVASKSLLAIINDVLDLSKIEAGELIVERAAFSPQELLKRLSDLVAVHASAKGIAFTIDAPQDLPAELVGDAKHLTQILTNLLSNAIRFTDHGGVTLSVLEVPSAKSGVTLSFAVQDTGIGIAPDAQARLFAPFAQADASITRRYGGTGLGLSIVKSLVDLSGGEITLVSTPGVGSEFKVVMTFEPAEPAAPAAVQAKPVGPGHRSLQGVRVLIVDDSDINLDVTQRILELAGAEVRLARNGLEAIEQLQAKPYDFDVVLMDVQMPVLDGHTATRRIRVELGLVDLPIIALTAGALSSERRRALAAGMDDFISKPFDAQTLQASILRHVGDERSQAPTLIDPAGEQRTQTAVPWPHIDGIDADLARQRLTNDVGLLVSSITRLLREFGDLRPPENPDPAALAAQGARMHKLKGIAGMLGAVDIHHLAAQAEAACSAGDAERAGQLATTLRMHLAKLGQSAAPTLQAAQRSSAEADAEAEAASDVALAPHLLKEMVQLLRQQSLSAQDYFIALSPQFHRYLGRERYATVRNHIGNLEFRAAADALEDPKIENKI
jgi:PAS domain S-box-containing protein